MDNEAIAMRKQMDKTLDRLADKFGKLELQVTGTVRTVTNTVNTVRDAFDIKLHVRRSPWTVLAGATALGFLCGFRPRADGAAHTTGNGGIVSQNPVCAPAAKSNDCVNAAGIACSPAAMAPGWLANFGDKFQPEIAALRGIAIGALLELGHEFITKQAAKPAAQSEKGANNATDALRARSRDVSEAHGAGP